MIERSDAKGVFLVNNQVLIEDDGNLTLEIMNRRLSQKNLQPLSSIDVETARKSTISYGILAKHNQSANMDHLQIRFDALASHDITYVGIIQTARASGLKEFPMPYVLTNCHNSLCAVGGTINEDDHVFGLSAAKKYGGIFVPAHLAVIHQYMREMMAGGGKMILGSDSHTRYGALGTMAMGEGGPELVKQLLGDTYNLKYPAVIAIFLEGKPQPGVGPHDVALAIIGAVFKEGYVKNKIMEFVGPGIANLSLDYRIGIDVMTTETACLSSIWATDDRVQEYYQTHGRGNDFARLAPGNLSYYDGVVTVDLGKVEPMIALPFHPSNVYAIKELQENARDILDKTEKEAQDVIENDEIRLHLQDKIVAGKVRVNQSVIAGCAGGTYENIYAAAEILKGQPIANHHFSLSVYPASQPVNLALMQTGAIETLIAAGAVTRTAFCGPCFGAGDVPANNAFSIRHTTRNFINREGSKLQEGQISSVALMDARSIAATASRGGVLTPATEVVEKEEIPSYRFSKQIYSTRVYSGFGKPRPGDELIFGPNIKDWPKMKSLPDHLLLKFAAVLEDPVTTTDELIPSGETSSYRSNPIRLAGFALSRKAPHYVAVSRQVQEWETAREGNAKLPAEIDSVIAALTDRGITIDLEHTSIGSLIYAVKPGDGSAREQAASCQKVLGGWANIAVEYATKRYRSNLVNWGLFPFILEDAAIRFKVNDYLYLPGIKSLAESDQETVKGWWISGQEAREIELKLPNLTKEEREILLAGSLMNYNAKRFIDR